MHLVGYFYAKYHDARSPEHEVNLVFQSTRLHSDIRRWLPYTQWVYFKKSYTGSIQLIGPCRCSTSVYL